MCSCVVCVPTPTRTFSDIGPSFPFQPVSRGRITHVEFGCGLIDKVVSVEEFETCTYIVEFTTPAACIEGGMGG